MMTFHPLHCSLHYRTSTTKNIIELCCGSRPLTDRKSSNSLSTLSLRVLGSHMAWNYIQLTFLRRIRKQNWCIAIDPIVVTSPFVCTCDQGHIGQGGQIGSRREETYVCRFNANLKYHCLAQPWIRVSSEASFSLQCLPVAPVLLQLHYSFLCRPKDDVVYLLGSAFANLIHRTFVSRVVVANDRYEAIVRDTLFSCSPRVWPGLIRSGLVGSTRSQAQPPLRNMRWRGNCVTNFYFCLHRSQAKSSFAIRPLVQCR